VNLLCFIPFPELLMSLRFNFTVQYIVHNIHLYICSLSALADVLGALAGHRSHIPYRNTKLTHVLQDTIGKNLT
jgi:VanZ family protein